MYDILICIGGIKEIIVGVNFLECTEKNFDTGILIFKTLLRET